MTKLDVKKLLGLRIKNLRKKRNLTQANLAEMVSVDAKYISCVESGRNFPSPDLIAKLSNALNIHPNELFKFEEAPTPIDLKSEIIKSLDTATVEEIEKIFIYTKFIIS